MNTSLSSSTNYRGISLFNVIGKVFDCAILLISNTCFQTSDMQFGFKQQHSTVVCSLLYHEVINHYLCTGSTVYSCILDASKAFEKVHYGTMFSNSACDDWMLSHPGRAVTIYDIHSLCARAYYQTFTPATIIAGFNKT